MQNIMLKQLSLDMGKQEYDMLQRIPAVENGFTNPAYNLSYDEYKEWLRITDNNSRGIDLPEDWIPYTTYVLYIDNVPVGYGRVRHSASEYLETVVGAGNLGYGIAKGCRGKGYGSILFKEGSDIRRPSIWKRSSVQEIWGTVSQRDTEEKDTEVFYSKNY